MKSIIIQTIKTVLIDIIGEILYFPLWWYSGGLKRTALYVFNSIRTINRNLSLVLMLKNLFKPMFGQYDRQGRIISFFMRLLLIFSRLIVFILLSVLNLLILILWLILPIAVIWGLVTNFSALWQQ